MNTIPARRGKATYLKQGQSIRIINTHGEQVVDTWAFTGEHADRVHVDGTHPRHAHPDASRGRATGSTPIAAAGS